MFRRLIILLLLLFTVSHFSMGQKSALLLIDIQEFYFPGGKMQLENPEAAGMNAGLLLEHFRNIGMPVYHVRHNFEPGGNIHSFVKPIEGEPVISKDEVNAFLNTDLLEVIRHDSVEQLVICGMQTHMCVEAAVRAAHDLGFSVLLASDACATRALQYKEHIITAKNVQYSTLSTLQGTYARVLSTDDIIKEFSRSGK